MYHRNSSGFLVNNWLRNVFIGGLKMSISPISDATLTIIRIRKVLARRGVVVSHNTMNIPRASIDSLSKRFGFSKLCS